MYANKEAHVGSVGRVTLYGELGVWIAGYACGLAFEWTDG